MVTDGRNVKTRSGSNRFVAPAVRSSARSHGLTCNPASQQSGAHHHSLDAATSACSLSASVEVADVIRAKISQQDFGGRRPSKLIKPRPAERSPAAPGAWLARAIRLQEYEADRIPSRCLPRTGGCPRRPEHPSRTTEASASRAHENSPRDFLGTPRFRTNPSASRPQDATDLGRNIKCNGPLRHQSPPAGTSATSHWLKLTLRSPLARTGPRNRGHESR